MFSPFRCFIYDFSMLFSIIILSHQQCLSYILFCPVIKTILIPRSDQRATHDTIQYDELICLYNGTHSVGNDHNGLTTDNAACALMSRRLLPDGAVRLIILHHVVLLQSKRKGDDGNVRHRPLLKGSQLIYSAFSFFFLL